MPRKKPRPVPNATTAPPVSNTRQRTSTTFTDEAVTALTASSPASRMSTPPPSSLDRLLHLSFELPATEGEDAVARGLLRGLADLFPGAAVGICFVGASGEPLVLRKHPTSGDRPAGIDPTRLFPHHAYEVVVEVPLEPQGSTLHAASDDPLLQADGGAISLLKRAAQVLRQGVHHARAHQGIRGAKSEVQTLTSQMVQAEKLASLGQIAAGMVHELNNPLTSIVAYSDYLTKRWAARTGAVDPDELERLRRIGESAHRLLRFTRDLVSYARPSSEVPVPVTLHGVIEKALTFCEHVLVEAGVKVDRRFAEDVSQVRGMPEQLTQVFVNLVTNACHAMPRGGQIAISTELPSARGGESPCVRIVVSDTGDGISEENLGRIFAPFFTTKTDGRGTGLGLSIVKSIVEGHGGHIEVTSEVDRGTRFVIALPVVER